MKTEMTVTTRTVRLVMTTTELMMPRWEAKRVDWGTVIVNQKSVPGISAPAIM